MLTVPVDVMYLYIMVMLLWNPPEPPNPHLAWTLADGGRVKVARGPRGERVLLIDDVLATGGTLKGMLQLLETFGAKVVSIGVLLELGFLHGREKLGQFPVESLIMVDKL